MGGQTRDCGRRCGIFVRAASPAWRGRYGRTGAQSRPVTRSLPSPV
ncbi:hypothetical protein [Azospirillum endophyticum]